MSFAAGQSWAYRAPEGFESSCAVIGAIVHYENRESVVCFSVYGAPRRGSALPGDIVTIPFIPMSASAFAATVTALRADAAELPEDFATQLHNWANDERGLAVFTVPFLGFLDQMMSMQMASMVGGQQAPAPAA